MSGRGASAESRLAKRVRQSDGVNTPQEVPSLFNLCKAVIISEEIPFSGRLGALEEMLEECNSETQGRLFRIFVLSEDDRSKTLQRILEERGVSPLFGHVFLPVDLSPLQMEDFEKGEYHYQYQDEVAGEMEEDEEGKKATKVKDDLTMELSTDTEVIVQVWDSKLTTTIWDNPILHGKGALYSKLGVEPTEWTQKESVRVTRRWVYRKDPIKVFVRVQDITTTLPPPNVKVVCWEVSRKDEEFGQRSRILPWPVSGFVKYSEQELKEQERGKGVLHAGHHGSEMEFCLTNPHDENEGDEDGENMYTIFDMISIYIVNAELGSGPEYHLIPTFLANAGAPGAYSVDEEWPRPWGKCKDLNELKERIREALLKVGMIQLDSI